MSAAAAAAAAVAVAVDAAPPLSSYVPVGCLSVDQSEAALTPSQWSHPSHARWCFFHVFGCAGLDPGLRMLPFATHALLIGTPPLRRYANLVNRHWIRLSLRIPGSRASPAIIRVYLLPDDVENARVPRSDASLRKARKLLLAKLDFSLDAWSGNLGLPPQVQPLVAAGGDGHGPHGPHGSHDPDDGRDESLLALFNSLPSPNPNPATVQDYNVQEAMDMLLNSTVPGLTTTLYPYQRRSAALMLQREAQPGKAVDPRLVKAIDQARQVWYYDPVGGYGLRRPRFYDQPCGGILAEEMGSGKTLICLAMILASLHIPAQIPEMCAPNSFARPRVASLLDMAAACVAQNGVPWRRELEVAGWDYANCISAIRRHPASYSIPDVRPRRETRRQAPALPPIDIWLSSCSLVIVPPNLVRQWKQEILKHTDQETHRLKYAIITRPKDVIPPPEDLRDLDLVIISSTRFERLLSEIDVSHCSLAKIRFKRCIIDEGHRLGSWTGSALSPKTNMQAVIEGLHISARWIATGTPSLGLYGVSDRTEEPAGACVPSGRPCNSDLAALERTDLKRIGAIAALYLKMLPWANNPNDWNMYVMGKKANVKPTLEALIIRHRLCEVDRLLPPVNESFVFLTGSYQDRLSLNLFSMVIVFNAVLSQREDQDFFFHPRQRKALNQLVSNMRSQASFFGGAFFSPADIAKSVERAEEFLREGKVKISAEDDVLLRDAIAFGHRAGRNVLKTCAHAFKEPPVYIENFPGSGRAGVGAAWSLDSRDGDPVCTSSPMVLALQKSLQPVATAPASFNLVLNSGRLAETGLEEQAQARGCADDAPIPAGPGQGNNSQGSGRGGTAGGAGKQDGRANPTRTTQKPAKRPVAGHAQMGDRGTNGGNQGRRLSLHGTIARNDEMDHFAATADQGGEVIDALASARLISTASAKLSYLIDEIIKHQADEQMIIFYENDNVAYWLAGVLEILQVHHLIYAKSLSAERRSIYVQTFNLNPKFRVLLMDISQAAFGLDMRSASRIYFISPVLNPQVEAQAVGRARRISQKKPVTVKTLVLRGSVEEIVVRRRGEMTQAEQRKCRSVLDDRPIYDYIMNARILAMEDDGDGDGSSEGNEEDREGLSQTALLEAPQRIFGRGLSAAEGGMASHPDQDLVATEEPGSKRSFESGPGSASALPVKKKRPKARASKRARFAAPAG